MEDTKYFRKHVFIDSRERPEGTPREKFRIDLNDQLARVRRLSLTGVQFFDNNIKPCWVPDYPLIIDEGLKRDIRELNTKNAYVDINLVVLNSFSENASQIDISEKTIDRISCAKTYDDAKKIADAAKYKILFDYTSKNKTELLTIVHKFAKNITKILDKIRKYNRQQNYEKYNPQNHPQNPAQPYSVLTVRELNSRMISNEATIERGNFVVLFPWVNTRRVMGNVTMPVTCNPVLNSIKALTLEWSVDPACEYLLVFEAECLQQLPR